MLLKEPGMPSAAVDDLAIIWEERGTGSPHAVPVILLNGLGAGRAGWARQTAALAEQFRVITLDNRDIGDTGATPGNRFYRMRQFAVDVIGLMDALGIERAHIVGASMGGAIAQELAITAPERLATVTIICSWPKTDPWLNELLIQWEQIFSEQGAVAWQRATLPWVYTHRWFATPNNLANELGAIVATPPVQTAAMYLRQSNAARSHDALDRLGAVTAPAHIICGAEDLLTPIRYSQQLAEHIGGSRLTILPNAGHGLFWETPAALNQALLEFLLLYAGETRSF
jgi:pimeloyl-ACP methyl ester carboxylesterase